MHGHLCDTTGPRGHHRRHGEGVRRDNGLHLRFEEGGVLLDGLHPLGFGFEFEVLNLLGGACIDILNERGLAQFIGDDFLHNGLRGCALLIDRVANLIFLRHDQREADLPGRLRGPLAVRLRFGNRRSGCHQEP